MFENPDRKLERLYSLQKNGARTMNKNNRVKVISRFLGILLCLILIQSACAKQEVSEEILISEDATYEDVTNENATVHTINPTYHYTYLVAGNSEKFTVSFKNEGNETLDVTPKVVPLPDTGSSINESWVTISPANATVEQGSVQEFTVEVSVPKDAESAAYQTAIAFTDDLQPNSTQYVNSMSLYVSVQANPKIELQTTYLSDVVKPGTEYEYMVKIKNVADKDVTIDPKVTSYPYGIYYSTSSSTVRPIDGEAIVAPSSSSTFGLSNDEVIIEAPSVIEAGEIVNMTIKVPVPENATGYFDGYIDMNVDGKTNDGSNSQLSLYLRAMQHPEVPYVKKFNTTSSTPITIEVSTDSYDQTTGLRISPKIEEPSFNVNLKCNSCPICITPSKVIQTSNVNIGENYFRLWAMDEKPIYQNANKHYAETYVIPGKTGEWELSILPQDMETFSYSITFGETE